jgi:hypothetical protein
VHLAGLQLVRVDDDQPDQVESFYRELIAAAAANANRPLLLDLSPMSFISTDVVMALITGARLWHHMTAQPTMLDGIQPEVHRYLERMDVFSICGEWIWQANPLDPAECWSRSDSPRKLVEVMPISADADQNAEDVTTAVGRVSRILATWFGNDQAAIGSIATMLSEVASNVTHSRDRGFAVVQHHHRPAGGRVTIAVGDLGIGIEASLHQHGVRLGRLHQGLPPVGSGAILHALELGVSSGGDVRGMGLYQVKTLVDRWRGILAIRSGRSAVMIAEGRIQVRDGLVGVPGTQVTITVRGDAGKIVPI